MTGVGEAGYDDCSRHCHCAAVGRDRLGLLHHDLSKPATTLKIKQGFNECARLDHLERALRHAHKASTVRFGSWATFRHRRGSWLLPLGQRAQVRHDFLQSLRTPLLHRFAILVGKEGG